jgi:hypothetical protein
MSAEGRAVHEGEGRSIPKRRDAHGAPLAVVMALARSVSSAAIAGATMSASVVGAVARACQSASPAWRRRSPASQSAGDVLKARPAGGALVAE